MPDATAEIRFDKVTKTFPGAARPAVDSLSLDLRPGEITVLVGPSGCGKTTTLKMINRLIEPTSGTIFIEGRDARSQPVHVLRRGIGYVIQQIGLFPHRTIAANIATVPTLAGWDKAEVHSRVRELAGLVGLDESLLERYPAELSGGQQQRVGVARALAADPPVLLMDEPYSAVDPIVRAHLQDELLALQSRVGKTIVLVTHDIDEAIKVGDRIAILNVGGHLEQFAPPADLLRDPANEFVARFLGRERSLKRMALLHVSDVELKAGPFVAADARPEDATAVMDEHRVDWVGVLGRGEVLGWAWGRDIADREFVGDAELHRFAAWVTPETGLREALDVIVDSRTRVAIVLDDSNLYLGLLTIDEIAEAMAK